MGFFKKYPLAWVVLFWISGLIFSNFVKFRFNFWLLLGLSISLSVTAYLLSRKFKYWQTAFILISGFSFFLAGWSYGRFFNPETKYLEIRRIWEKTPVLSVEFQISRIEKRTEYYQQYTAEVKKINGQASDFKIWLKIPADKCFQISFDKIYEYTPQPGEWKNLPPPTFPFGFQYDQYLINKGIYAVLILKNPRKAKIKRNSRESFFSELRRKIRTKIFESLNHSTHAGVLSALLLGDKQFIDYSTKEKFIRAGVMHVLAISGLHIGILLFFLRLVFRPFKSRRWVYNLLVLSALWFYALLTGLPSSVFRAATMFSLFQLAWEIQREVQSYYVLILSAFIILLFRPSEWQNPGFILSFGAVASIITFFPLMKKFWYPENPFFKYFFDLIYVSIAAQIGLLPVLLYFFHKFSFGFLLANVFVIPLISIVLITGFLMLPLWSLGFVMHQTGYVLQLILEILISIIEKISNWGLVVEHFYFGFFYMLALSVLVFGFAFLYQTRQLTWSKSIIVLGIVSIFLMLDLQKQFKQNQIVLTQPYYNTPSLYIAEKNRLDFYSDSLLSHYHKTLFKNHLNIDFFQSQSFPVQFKIRNKKYLLINGNLPDSIFHQKVNTLILHASPKINLDLYIKRLQPEEIIITKYNYIFLRNRWKKTALKHRIRLTDLNETGYIVLHENY